MSEQSVVRSRVLVSGRVQGVGFRAFTQIQAREGKLRGWVRNLHDGRVEAEVEGPRSAIEVFVAALKDGPRFSQVDTVEVEWTEASGLDSDFRIRY